VFVAVTRGIAAAACGGAAAVLLSGCGGSDSTPRTSSSAAAAATVRTASCKDWNAAPAAEQQQLVRGLREFFGGQVDTPGLRGQVLPDAKATRLFNSYCAQSYAAAFSLYRLYGNAAAFTNHKK
jgi:hypothetical protein